MNLFRTLGMLAVGTGVFVFQANQKPIYADASGSPRMVAQTEQAPATPGQEKPGAESYAKHCAICHGDHREGILPAFPPLLGIEHRLTGKQVDDLIRKGKGRMPGFPKLQNEEVASLQRYLETPEMPAAGATPGAANSTSVHASELSKAGGALFQQNCAFCHGRDAMGGETGPDLTRSKLVLADESGEKISEVIRQGRIEKKMPAFHFSGQELNGLVAFIQAQVVEAASHKGSRRGVDVADLQTGNLEKGKQYFNGAGGCVKCHSATGDLAGVATRFEGLQLEERMLYPRDVKSRVTVTLPSGHKVAGILAYRDEFTVGLRDDAGTYRSWAVQNIKYAVESPVDAHVDLFSKYTDEDIHNLMAYLQTLR